MFTALGLVLGFASLQPHLRKRDRIKTTMEQQQDSAMKTALPQSPLTYTRYPSFQTLSESIQILWCDLPAQADSPGCQLCGATVSATRQLLQEQDGSACISRLHELHVLKLTLPWRWHCNLRHVGLSDVELQVLRRVDRCT